MPDKLYLDKLPDRLIVAMPAEVRYFDDYAYDARPEKAAYDCIIRFAYSIDDFLRFVREAAHDGLLNPNGYLYIAYPKKGSKRYKETVDRDALIAYADTDDGFFEGTELKFNRMCALNEDFTIVGLKRLLTRPKTSAASQCVADYEDKVADVEARLAEIADVAAIYAALAPGYRRDWARYLFSVKAESTREKRFEEMVMILRQGYKSKALYRRGV